MIEILPIKLLTDEDGLIFGSLNINLAKLARMGFPVAPGVVITAPEFKLKTVLEHYDFGAKEIIEQSLTLVKKELASIPIPLQLQKETKGVKYFFLNDEVKSSAKQVWQVLIAIWLDEIKKRLWKDGFYPGITQNLDAQVVIFIKKIDAAGNAFFDFLQDDVIINIKKGKLHPNDQKKIFDLVKLANKKLFIPHDYEWILDGGVKLVGIKPYTPDPIITSTIGESQSPTRIALSQVPRNDKMNSAVKVFLDLSSSLIIDKNIDGIYICSEKIFDLNNPTDSFEDLVFKIVESAKTFPDSPVFLKLADVSEGMSDGRQGMGKVRGALRLLHQKSLFDPVTDALSFARHKKGLTNIHIVIPFIRGVQELLQLKRELATKKLMRKNSLQIWMEVCIPENIINLEDYLIAGVDGVVLNLDELISFLNGFDKTCDEMTFYKKEVTGLLKFLDDGLKLLHKSKVRFLAYGSLTLHPQVLDFLVEKGVYGVVAEKYEAPSAKDLLYQTEKRIILGRSA